MNVQKTMSENTYSPRAFSNGTEKKAAAGRQRRFARCLRILARALRVISLPPIAITALLGVLVRSDSGAFRTGTEVLLCWCFLALTPVLAYPVSYLIPRLRTGGRKTQRRLAFLFSLAGYAGGFAYGLLAHVATGAMTIYTAYFCSVILLALCNRLTPLRASGHAAGMTGALFFSAWFVGGAAIPVGICAFAAVLWASLYTKRHTAWEFLAGTGLSLISAFAACLLL